MMRESEVVISTRCERERAMSDLNKSAAVTIVCWVLAAFWVPLIAGGCGVLKRSSLPPELANDAVIPGMPYARFWGDAADDTLNERFLAALEEERGALHLSHTDSLPSAHYLAISGGGPDGAYGAGLLCGWSQRGDRPQFKIVTGTSTGALIAPFAFVGPDYDHVLRDVYTKVSTKDIERSRGLLAGLFSDGLSDTKPLKRLVAKHVDEEFLRRVAEESSKGRILVLATTNLDAQRPVIWSMGAIARSGHPDSLQLFRDVMVASASIPGIFSPVIIRVEADGSTYEEMHVDGGVTSQVFLYPASFSFSHLGDHAADTRERHVYVIRNAKTDPEPSLVKRRTVPIAFRAISTLIKNQAVGDLYRIYLGSLRDGIDYKLASIPESFAIAPTEPFDPHYMQQLFELGYSRAIDGYPWKDAPPGFEPPRSAQERYLHEQRPSDSSPSETK
jgi:hypothetical protein